MEQFEGYIENFNGVFGFVSFEKGVAFFHKSFLKPEFLDKIVKNKKVIFTAQPSLKKPDSWEVASFKSILEETKPKKNFYSDFSKLEIGEVDWFNDLKGFGVLKNAKGSFFVHKNKLLNVGSLSKNDICLFKAVFSDNKGRYDAHNVQLVNRLDLANIYLQIINKIDDNEKYQQVTRIYDKLDTNQHADFIQQAYQIADEQRKYVLLANYSIPVPEMELIQKWYNEKMVNFNFEIIKNLSKSYQNKFIEFFYEQVQTVDSEEKYQQVTKIYDKLDTNQRAGFIQQAYQIADEQRKYVLLANYSIPVPEMELIQKWYNEKMVNFNFEIIKNLFLFLKWN
jgi:cold shock CspA family protein